MIGGERLVPPQSAGTGRALPALAHIFTVVPSVLSWALALVFLSVAIRGLTALAPTTNAEGNQFHAVLRIQTGESLYLNYREMPAIVTPYTPIFYVLNGLLSRALNLGLQDALALTRSLALASTLGIAVMVFAISRAGGATRLAALTGAGSFLALPFLDRWGFTSRPDTLAIVLSMMAAAVLARTSSLVPLAATIAVVAFFTKQTAIALPVAATLWLALNGRRRDAVVFVGTWVSLALLIGAPLQAVTGGLFLENVFLAHLNPTNGFESAARTILELPLHTWPMLALATSAVIFEARQRALGLFSIYWLVALGVLFYTLRGRGAAENYFIEPSALTCILGSIALARINTWQSTAPWRTLAFSMMVTIAYAAWGWHTWQYWRVGGELSLDHPVQVPEIARAERIWAEEPSLVVFAGKPLLVSDPFLLSQMTEAGRYDPSFLVNQIRARQFDLILVRGDARQPRSLNGQLKWPEGALKAVAEFYQPRGTRGPYWVYRPDRPRSAS